MSQYIFGAQNGKCGFTKPTPRKNGFSAAASRLSVSMAFTAV